MPTLTILGRRVSTPEPYSRGHVCTEAEASTLNAALTRTLAKALDRLLREASACESGPREVSEREVQGCIAAGLRSFYEGAERLRAIESEAKRIGRSRVEAALYRSGKRLAELASGEQSELIAREAGREEVFAEAVRRIDTIRSIGMFEDLLGGSDAV